MSAARDFNEAAWISQQLDRLITLLDSALSGQVRPVKLQKLLDRLPPARLRAFEAWEAKCARLNIRVTHAERMDYARELRAGRQM